MSRHPSSVEVWQLNSHGASLNVHVHGRATGRPPVLFIQAGPGLPTLSDVPRLQRSLGLERWATVAYWDQRGSGPQPVAADDDLRLSVLLDDVQVVVAALAQACGQPVLLLGVSLGATLALRLAARQPQLVRGVVAVSPDVDGAASDTAAAAAIQAWAQGHRGRERRLRRLPPPPYAEPRAFQARAQWLMRMGAIEAGRRPFAQIVGWLTALRRTYGWLGMVRSLRHMSQTQRALLLELNALDLLTPPPQPLTVPLHVLVGRQDALLPRALAQKAVARWGGSAGRLTELAPAGHMAHWDCPDQVAQAVREWLQPRSTAPLAPRRSLEIDIPH